MAEKTWYYSQGDKELGPITQGQLRQLAAAGTLQSSDLVWREGMQDWTPAGQVDGLLSGALPNAAPAPARRGDPNPGLHWWLVHERRRVAEVLLIIGILLVLTARGCDGLGTRNVRRLDAKHQAAQQAFRDRWELELASTTDAAELQDLMQKKAEEEAELATGTWREMGIAARDAERNNTIWAYWREMLFLFGSQLLTVGLLIVGFTGEGPERWVCLIMLAIITYSLYVEGAAWLASS